MDAKKRGKVKAFFDFEFTGLHCNTTPISLGIVTSNGKEFYSEFTDYDKEQVEDWALDNIFPSLLMHDMGDRYKKTLGSVTMVKGDSDCVRSALREWVSQFKSVEFWGDCMWYDGVLLNEALGGAFNLPESVKYIYFDIATLFRTHGIDPDISREAFIDTPIEGSKHNALYDARVIQRCYDKLYKNRERYPFVL